MDLVYGFRGVGIVYTGAGQPKASKTVVSKGPRYRKRLSQLTSRHRTTRPKHRNQPLNSRPNTHTTARQPRNNINRRRQTDGPALLETPDPAAGALIHADRLAGVRVEALAGQDGGLLDGVAEVEHSGEAVGKVDHEEGADEADDAADVGDGGGDDEGQDPVDGAEAVPGDLALAGGDGREAEALLEDFEVNCLHADVEVHDCLLGISFVYVSVVSFRFVNLQTAMRPVSKVKMLPAVCSG
jgi:hypothetical protein